MIIFVLPLRFVVAQDAAQDGKLPTVRACDSRGSAPGVLSGRRGHQRWIRRPAAAVYSRRPRAHSSWLLQVEEILLAPVVKTGQHDRSNYQRFGGTYCLHRQGRGRAIFSSTAMTCALKVEAGSSPKMFVTSIGLHIVITQNAVYHHRSDSLRSGILCWYLYWMFVDPCGWKASGGPRLSLFIIVIFLVFLIFSAISLFVFYCSFPSPSPPPPQLVISSYSSFPPLRFSISSSSPSFCSFLLFFLSFFLSPPLPTLSLILLFSLSPPPPSSSPILFLSFLSSYFLLLPIFLFFSHINFFSYS
jgi:hypothetical protein